MRIRNSGSCRIGKRMYRKQPGFTLVELLVVIGIIAVLVGLLLPVLSKARAEASRAKCLSNLRTMQIAQTLYAAENRGYLIQAGFGHNGIDNKPDIAWFETLQRYGSNKLVPRCPADRSPHWQDDDGVPIAGSVSAYRLTSYGINDFLDRELCPWGPAFDTTMPPGGWYVKMSQVRRTSVTIQFLEMAYVGAFAAADHPHVENWAGANVPASALKSMQVNAHGGKLPVTKQSVANYGFLDGHAESLRFDDVFRSFTINKFDPAIAQ